MAFFKKSESQYACQQLNAYIQQTQKTNKIQTISSLQSKRDIYIFLFSRNLLHPFNFFVQCKTISKCKYRRYISQQTFNIYFDMKGEFEARPLSKNVQKNIRPSSFYAKPELAAESFTNGKKFQLQSMYQQAIEQYLRALMYDPNYFQAYCNMGTCYRAQKKYLEARSMYIKAIAIKSDDAISHYNLANTLRIIGNYQDSIKQYEFVIALGEKGINLGSLHADSLVNLGICYKQKQELQKSIQCFEKARKINPRDQSIIFNEAMTYMAILQTINTDIYFETVLEKTEKAEALLKQILKMNPNNEMALLKLHRISTILDKSNKNLNIIANKLRVMLQNEQSKLKNEINEQLGYVLNLLKEYQKSARHYQQSISYPEVHSIIDIIESNTSFIDKQDTLTQQEAIAMINQGRISEVNSFIDTLQSDDITKHVLQLAVQLYLSQTQEQSEQYFNYAVDIYNQFFIIDNKQLPDQKLSIEAHKLLGKLFALQQKYKQSIRHYQYVSMLLKNSGQRSKVRSSLGNDYEALGNKQKALEQYKLALNEQPDNYEIMYNIGCCLHDEGNHQESKKYFQQFLTLIKRDNRVYLPTKYLYIADCLITLAMTSDSQSDQFQRYQNAWRAIKQSKQGEKEKNVELQSEKLLNYCLKWTDILQLKLLNINDKKSEEYISTKQTLLDAYMQLLEIQTCPDRDAILNNCAIIYYQEKLYVNALANLNQVAFPSASSLNSLALTYFHLGEHIVASNAMSSATEKSDGDELIKFNKEIMHWVYGINKDGAISKIFDNHDETLVIARWQYGILLIDAFSLSLKQIKDDADVNQEIVKITHKLLEGNQTQKYLDDVDKIKFRYLHNALKNKGQSIQKDQFPQHILQKCTNQSENIEADLKLILILLQNNKQCSQTVIELLLSIFIFVNKQKSNEIRSILQQHSQRKSQKIPLSIDKKVMMRQSDKSKQYTFECIDDIIVNFCSWQCQLETKSVLLMTTIEKSYYNCKFRYPLEIQYCFPRHNNYDQCNTTLNRIISLVYGTFNLKPENSLSEGTITQMKEEILRSMDQDFDIHLKISPSFWNLTLNQNLYLATIYANFQSKSECIKFIKDLQAQCSQQAVQINEDNEQLILMVSGIFKVQCRWAQKQSLETAINSLIKSPLGLYFQSIIQINADLDILKDSPENIKKLLSKISQFNV